MPRTLDDIVRDMLGRQLLEIARLQAEVEKLTEALAKATAPKES